MSDATITATFASGSPPLDVEQHIRTLSRIAELSPDQVLHIREQRAVDQATYEQAEVAHERFKRDGDRVRRFFSGDSDVRKEVMGLRLILGSRVKGA